MRILIQGEVTHKMGGMTERVSEQAEVSVNHRLGLVTLLSFSMCMSWELHFSSLRLAALSPGVTFALLLNPFPAPAAVPCAGCGYSAVLSATAAREGQSLDAGAEVPGGLIAFGGAYPALARHRLYVLKKHPESDPQNSKTGLRKTGLNKLQALQICSLFLDLKYTQAHVCKYFTPEVLGVAFFN